MRYYFLKRQVKKGEFVLEEYSSEDSNLSRRLSKGERIGEAVDLELYHNGKVSFTDLLDTSTFFLVSDKLRGILEQNCKTEYVSFYEVKVVSTLDNSNIKYFLVNLIKNVDAIDYEASNIDFYEGSTVIKSVKRIELNGKIIGDREIFRLTKLKTEIALTEKLKKVIEKAGVTGVRFVPIEDYRE